MKRIYFCILAFVFMLAHTGFAQVPVMNPIQGSNTICWDPMAGFSFTTSATNSPSGYTWSILPAVASITFNNHDTTGVFFPNMNGTYTLSCYATNGSGSSAPVSFVISVFEKPNVTFSGNTLLCMGGSVNLSASPTIIQASSTLNSGSSTLFYTWSPGTGLNTTTGPSVTANPAMTTTYTVSVQNGPCTSTTAVTISIDTLCLTSIATQEKALDNILIYPNPSSGALTVRFDNWNGEDVTLQLIASTGEAVLSDKIKAPQLVYDIARLQRGLYFVVFKNKSGTKTVKLIKE